MRKIGLFLLLAGILVATPFSTLMADEVVVYTSVDDVFARPISEQFERETGIKVRLVTDTEETKSTGLLNRLIAEKKRPRADVFWSGDPIRAAILKSKGISSPYHSTAAKGLPPMYSDPKGHWIGFSARARIILYNKNLVKIGSEPNSIMDLLSPEYKGNICMANPLFGTTSMHAAALFVSFGEEKAKQYFADLKNNGLKLLSSNGEVRRRVSSGDCAYGITDTDDAYTALRDGKPVGVIFPDQKGTGTLIMPNATVLIANAPHPEAAKRFIDFLLSPETEEALASGEAAQMPLRPHLKGPEGFPELSEIQPMQVNYSELAEALESLSKGFLREWAGRF
ncbi:MAG: iron ABC transporter substrate-binding protein [Gammaproteobacteria bacterium]|nr:MAG: iron ABC transporter substrate-binding protein [Gammaproteobacteria bacterium]RLA22711.1 MAG: iron ABC transporter substrate-binding protein [Gammaproteobacteria bacterium]